jgi:hypothetical protein
MPSREYHPAWREQDVLSTEASRELHQRWVDLRDYVPPVQPIEELRGNAPPPSNWKYQQAVGVQILRREYNSMKQLTLVKDTQ